MQRTRSCGLFLEESGYSRHGDGSQGILHEKLLFPTECRLGGPLLFHKTSYLDSKAPAEGNYPTTQCQAGQGFSLSTKWVGGMMKGSRVESWPWCPEPLPEVDPEAPEPRSAVQGPAAPDLSLSVRNRNQTWPLKSFMFSVWFLRFSSYQLLPITLIRYPSKATYEEILGS